jgi:alpha-N-arabinofuranosidase
MKIVDPTIETVLCGSSLNSMDTFPEWEATVLDDAYEYADYISLHQYFGGQEKGTEQFLAQADELDEYICTVKSVIRYIKAKKKTEKPVNISFDEWGVWTHASSDTVKQTDEKRWETAPAISEMIYSFEDSLLFAEMLMAFIRNADSVKIACQALIANISSMIITEKGGGLWYQPTYYQFSAMSKYGKGIIL